jgi:hypothetical protein
MLAGESEARRSWARKIAIGLLLVGMQADYNLQVAGKEKRLAKRFGETRKAAAMFEC